MGMTAFWAVKAGIYIVLKWYNVTTRNNFFTTVNNATDLLQSVIVFMKNMSNGIH